MKKIIYFFIFLIICDIQIFSQVLSGKVAEPQFGFSFTIPQNWQGTKSEKGYLLISKEQKGFILITPHNFNSLEEIENNANEGINSGTGTTLTLVGQLSKTKNNGIAGTFRGILDGQSTIAYLMSLLSPYGGGISIFAFINVQNYSDDYEEIVNSISQSVVFSEPKLKNSVAEDWRIALNNCRLTHINNYKNEKGKGSSTQSKIIIDLCEKGYFNYKNESNGVINQDEVDEYSSGSRVGAGEWKVLNRRDHAELQLLFYNGDVKDFLLTKEGDKTFLNGDHYFRTYKNNNAEGTQPDCFGN